ncbi:unnamed protein product [Amoebophrya sp. A25]|nr:unnamed protein product [Amoebophrya sp. A25]|eukprot:GSA25T00012150001.1
MTLVLAVVLNRSGLFLTYGHAVVGQASYFELVSGLGTFYDKNKPKRNKEARKKNSMNCLGGLRIQKKEINAMNSINSTCRARLITYVVPIQPITNLMKVEH